MGRWTQATPIGGSLQEATKANPYVYADNDSINRVDPTGKQSCLQLSNGELDAIGWFGILQGAGLGIAAGFAAGTIIGLPAAGVLGGLGIASGTAGTYILWASDKYYPNGGFDLVCW